MTSFLKIANADGLIRDRHSKSIASVDASALAQYRRNRERMQMREKRINTLEEKLERLEKLLMPIFKQDSAE